MEFADNVLHGNNAKVHSLLSSKKKKDESSSISAVSMLLEISERFGWDNEDKAGWSKVNFELLGTSKGGRIPRILDNNGESSKTSSSISRNGGREDKKEVLKSRDGILGEEGKSEVEEQKKKKKKKSCLGSFRLLKSQGFDKEDEKVEIYPFPGRQALLNKALHIHRRKI